MYVALNDESISLFLMYFSTYLYFVTYHAQYFTQSLVTKQQNYVRNMP